MNDSQIEFWKIICSSLLPKLKSFGEKVYVYETVHHHQNFKNKLTLEKKERKYHDLINKGVETFSSINYFEEKIKQSIKIQGQKIELDKINLNIDAFPREYIPIISYVVDTYQFLANKKIIQIDNTKNIYLLNKKNEEKDSKYLTVLPTDKKERDNFKIHWLGFEIRFVQQDIKKLFSMNFSYDQKQDILNNIFGLPMTYLPIIEQNKDAITAKLLNNSKQLNKSKKELKLFIDWSGQVYLI